MIAGPGIRLPLRSWANSAAYAGQPIGLVAAAWIPLARNSRPDSLYASRVRVGFYRDVAGLRRRNGTS